MQIKTKIYLSLFVFLLAVSLQACLVERVLTTVVHAVPHDHHPLNHDQDSHEDEFCCNNALNAYIGSQFGPGFNVEQVFTYAIRKTSAQGQTTDPAKERYTLYHLKPPESSRTRDKYALTCLLHAPPLA